MFFLSVKLIWVCRRYGFFVTVAHVYIILSAYDNNMSFNVGESPPSLFCYA